MDSNSSFNNFSIVIPIYNEEEILAESINNILSICERTSVEYEIIISENGSTDNTKNLARDFEQNNSKIVLIESDHPCLLYTSPSPRDMRRSRMPSSA